VSDEQTPLFRIHKQAAIADAAFRFHLPSPPGGGQGEELFRIEADGRCYCRGELVETNPEVWELFKRWLDAASARSLPSLIARLEEVERELAELKRRYGSR
jgi:hypothetical protein